LKKRRKKITKENKREKVFFFCVLLYHERCVHHFCGKLHIKSQRKKTYNSHSTLIVKKTLVSLCICKLLNIAKPIGSNEILEATIKVSQNEEDSCFSHIHSPSKHELASFVA